MLRAGTCLPASMQSTSIASTVRPAAFPGKQVVLMNQPQTNCTTSPRAPWRQRCHYVRNIYVDVVVEASFMTSLGMQSPANYNFGAEKVWQTCVTAITEECIKLHGIGNCMALLLVAVNGGSGGTGGGGDGDGDVRLEVLLPALLGGALACAGRGLRGRHTAESW